ncbi:tetratricopeptide repeat domain-containing protein [Trichoderma breve]|uniref:Tetratricopeptide repeat domain-containing protein n=1 Tax=Trichoderma breve TaxID=2034170 RepID=A0A9W9E3N1_9HYPO|nr:tetratricopeptide repeat domain-containing protein [Trichoderma breve]KAJ4857793.1 tetratricopeptide repeat domain-containing protein [Trichoderma breve]
MANEIMSADHKISSNAFGSNTQIHQGDTTVIHNYGSNASRKAHFMLPFPPNENIVCRPEIIAKIDKHLTRSKGGHYCGAALWGLGGSGKTQIALDYAYRRSHEDPACDIFWVHADNKTSFTRDYQRIARNLGLDYKVNGEELFVTVCHRIRSLQRWLLILDNADDLALFGVGVGGQIKSLFEYIPHGPGGTVLWTSRDEQIVSLVGSLRGVQISHMGIEEAESLLAMTRRDDIGADEIQEAKLLLQELQWLPLAVFQAGSYMRRTSTLIKKYLSKLLEGKSRWDMLKQSQHDRHRRPNVSNSVLETWNISISHIRKESEITYKVLHTIAYLDSEKIPLSLILAASNDNQPGQETSSHSEEEVLRMIISRLKEFSFISERKEENCDEPSFDMHKLVQYAIRFQLHTEDITLETYFATAALRVVTSLFPKEITTKTRRVCEKYATHAIQVSFWADLSEHVITTSSFLIDVAVYFSFYGALERGAYMAKRAVDLLNNYPVKIYPKNWICIFSVFTLARLEQAFGKDHHCAITTKETLVWIYRDQGRYKEAEELQIKGLSFHQKLYGEKERCTIDAMAELASIYADQKRYDEAKKLKIKTLALYSEVLGERHPATVDAMGSLAETYILTGMVEEGKRLELEAMSLLQNVSGDIPPHELRLKFNEMATICEIKSAKRRGIWRLLEVLSPKFKKGRRPWVLLILFWASNAACMWKMLVFLWAPRLTKGYPGQAREYVPIVEAILSHIVSLAFWRFATV